MRVLRSVTFLGADGRVLAHFFFRHGLAGARHHRPLTGDQRQIDRARGHLLGVFCREAQDHVHYDLLDLGNLQRVLVPRSLVSLGTITASSVLQARDIVFFPATGWTVRFLLLAPRAFARGRLGGTRRRPSALPPFAAGPCHLCGGFVGLPAGFSPLSDFASAIDRSPDRLATRTCAWWKLKMRTRYSVASCSRRCTQK